MIARKPPSAAAADVLHLLNGEQYSGLERVVDHLAAHAADFGYRLHLVFLKEGPVAERMHSRTAVIHSAPMRSRFDFRVIPRILKIARDTSSVLIHSHTVRSALIAFPLSRLAGLPWLHHVHSPALQESEHTQLNRSNALIERVLLPRAAHLLPVSEALACYVRQRYRVNGVRISVVRNGIGADALPIARRHCVTPTIAALGLFRPRKGIETLLLALRHLSETGLSFKAKLIGECVDARYERSLREQVHRLDLAGQLEFTGFSRNVRGELADADIFAMPSLYGEGMPMALLEAMGMPCAIVASDIEGIRELIEPGVTGLLTPPGDSAALASALRRLLLDADLRSSLAHAARLRQQSEHSSAAMARRVFAVYDRCLERRNAAREG